MLKRKGRKRIRHALTALGLFLVFDYIVLPQLAGARKSWHLITDVHAGWLVAAVVLEFAALAAYTELTRSLLVPEGRPSRWALERINMSAFAVSHLVPGGAAAGAALSMQLFADFGVPASASAFALATQGLGSALVLNILLWLALVVSIPARGFDPLYGTAAVLGSVLILGIAVLFVLLTRRAAGAARFVRAVARRVRFIDEHKVQDAVHEASQRLLALVADGRLMGRTIGWASANWLLDAASLWVFLYAFGHRTTLVGLLVAYGLANVLAAIPITPGGLGIVEGVLVPTLVAFGAARGQAILAVLAWRLVNFWLPIPVGAACYVSLRVGPHSSRREKREAVTVLVEQAEAIRREESARREDTKRRDDAARRDEGPAAAGS